MLIARPSFRKIIHETALAVTFTSISTLTKQDQTFTVPGVRVGDPIFLGLPAAPTSGIVFQAFVSAVNMVTIRANNYTGGSINPGAQTFQVMIPQIY